MKKAWCVELINNEVLYVAYFDSEYEARMDANRIFQLHAMPSVFQTLINV